MSSAFCLDEYLCQPGWRYLSPQQIPQTQNITFQSNTYTVQLIKVQYMGYLLGLNIRCTGSYGCREIVVNLNEANNSPIYSFKIRDIYEQGFYATSESGFFPFVSLYDDVNKDYQVNIIPPYKFPLKGLIVNLQIPQADGVNFSEGETATLAFSYLLQVCTTSVVG